MRRLPILEIAKVALSIAIGVLVVATGVWLQVQFLTALNRFEERLRVEIHAGNERRRDIEELRKEDTEIKKDVEVAKKAKPPRIVVVAPTAIILITPTPTPGPTQTPTPKRKGLFQFN